MSLPPNLSGGPLPDTDYQALEAGWISREQADTALLLRVNSIDGAAIVGKEGKPGNYSGIVIPYCWPGEGHVRTHRIRRDHPDLEADHTGMMSHCRKYIGPPGRGNTLYFPAALEARHLDDAGMPLVIVEGEFKALALWRLAWHGLGEAAESPAFVPESLSAEPPFESSTLSILTIPLSALATFSRQQGRFQFTLDGYSRRQWRSELLSLNVLEVCAF